MKKNFFKHTAAIISAVALSISVPIIADYYSIAAADNNIATPTDAIQNEFTTAPITLKVGDILKLTSTTIDPLISEEAVNLNSSVMHIYFAESDSALYDTSYLTSTYAYSFLDPETFAPVYEGYATQTEMRELWNQKSAGTLEYDGKKVALSNSVAPYYLRAKKSGSFTITIPEYAIGSGENVTTMKVNIPVVIEKESAFIEEVTTKPITLKVGDTFPLLSTDIDQLISNEIAEANKGLDYVYWVGNPNDNNAIIDEIYLSAVYCYEILDANTYESLYTGYGTPAEMDELAKQYLEGNFKYDGKDATFVETGSPYYVRAEQAGNTTITIPAYRVGEYSNNITIEVKIPVIIESNTITSNTDSTITINAGNILSAGTSLTTAKLESGDIFEAAKKLVTDKLENVVKYAVYELNLTAANNSEIHELAGKVKVTMNVPFEMSAGNTLKVFRIDGDILTECASTIANGKVTFETDHFSTYILAEQNTNSAPATGDMNNICLYIVLIGVCTAYCLIGYTKFIYMINLHSLF